MKYSCCFLNSAVNTIQLLLTSSNICTKFFFKAFVDQANLHLNKIISPSMKGTTANVCFIFVTVDITVTSTVDTTIHW